MVVKYLIVFFLTKMLNSHLGLAATINNIKDTDVEHLDGGKWNSTKESNDNETYTFIQYDNDNLSELNTTNTEHLLSSYNYENIVEKTNETSLKNDYSDTTEDVLDDPNQSYYLQRDDASHAIIHPVEILEPEYIFIPDMPRKSRQLNNETKMTAESLQISNSTVLQDSDDAIAETDSIVNVNIDVDQRNENVAKLSESSKNYTENPIFIGRSSDVYADDMMFGGDAMPQSSEVVVVTEKCCKCPTSSTISPTLLGQPIDDCPCRNRTMMRAAEDDDMMVGASNMFNSIVKNFAGPKTLSSASPTPILKPEVGFANSFIETLKTASEKELIKARERDAARVVKNIRKKAELDRQEAEEDVKLKMASPLKLGLTGKLSSIRKKPIKDRNTNVRNSLIDSDFAGSENVPSIVVQPDYLMRRPGTPNRSVAPVYIGLPALRSASRPAILSRVATPPTRASLRTSILGKSALSSTRPLLSQSKLSKIGNRRNEDSAVLGSSSSTKTEVPEDRSRRLLTAIKDALGLDKNQHYKCKIIINDD